MKIGDKYLSTLTVTDAHSALRLGSGDMSVLGTPAMIALMENAAMMALKPSLEVGQSSVGIAISAEHTRATAIGSQISATAEIVAIDGRRVEFNITAHDANGEIGTARHSRFIVMIEKFMSKL